MPTPKDSKAIAGRIDITYHRRPHWYRWWRRFLVVLSLFVTLAFVIWQIGGHHERWLNPGHVSAAHASFENECARCHDNDGKRGFAKTVSDTACIKCHCDAAAHNPLADLHPGKQRAVHLTSLKNPMKSADCTACHIEHRGTAAMAGTGDQLCVQCHGDLANHLSGGSKMKVGFDAHVTMFKPGSHPEFGRSLARSTPQKIAAAAQPITEWADNTVLHFNHWRHLNPEGPIHIQGCASCHSTEERPTGRWSLVIAATQPGSGSARKYMRPVSYERDCRRCHSVGLPPTKDLGKLGLKIAPVVTHGPMEIVRSELNDLNRLYLNLIEDHTGLLKADKPLAEWLKEQQDELIESNLNKVKTFGEALGDAQEVVKKIVVAREELKNELEKKPLNPVKVKKLGEPLVEALVDAQEAVQKNVDAREELKKELEKKSLDPARVKELLDQIYDPESAVSAVEKVRSLLAVAAEQQVAFQSGSSSCSTCHETAGKVLLAADYMKDLSTAKTQASEFKPLRLRTLPTGLPETSRRWFAASDFNHDAHRTTGCLECHQGMERDGLDKHTDDGIARMPAMKSCAACHIQDHADVRGAGNGCVTCHHFHDRSLERSSDLRAGK